MSAVPRDHLSRLERSRLAFEQQQLAELYRIKLAYHDMRLDSGRPRQLGPNIIDLVAARVRREG